MLVAIISKRVTTIAKQLNIPYHKVLKTELYNSIKIKLMQII